MEKLSFQELQDICQSLGAFANARSQEQPDKDLILTIKKVNGRELLQTTRLSKMSWWSRFVRWFGFGGSRLKAVADFLQNHEPYLPSFSRLKNRDILSYLYTEDAINNLTSIEKEQLKILRKQKIQGYEVFKNCVSNHNRRNSKQIYILLQEYGKKSLTRSGSINGGGVIHSWPNPMGVFQSKDERVLREHYQSPIIDTNEFMYLDPSLRSATGVSPKVLGFCYEYGLGTKKNMELAIENYQKAANDNEYSACYNLARLLLNQNHIQEAIDSLKKAEDILLKKVDEAQEVIKDMRLKPFNNEILFHQPEREETAEELEKRMKKVEDLERKQAPYIKIWNKALRQIYFVFIEAYKLTGNHVLKAEYEQKLIRLG